MKYPHNNAVGIWFVFFALAFLTVITLYLWKSVSGMK